MPVCTCSMWHLDSSKDASTTSDRNAGAVSEVAGMFAAAQAATDGANVPAEVPVAQPAPSMAPSRQQPVAQTAGPADLGMALDAEASA